MEESAKLAPAPRPAAVDPAAPPLFLSHPDQATTLTLLYDISRELTSILDRDALLRGIAQHVKKLVDYDVFTVMLWNESTQLLESVFALHYEDTIASRFRVPLGEGIAGSAAANRTSIRIPDVSLDPRYVQCETSQGIRSELVVPLLLQDRLIGVLDLESTEPRAFTEEHERVLSALSPFIAIALENSRLYQEARQNEQRLLAELDTAREIQRQLLPRGAREVPGLDVAASYVPARELGGDFYDFLPYGNGRLALVLGDVSGKGTPAALFGSLAIGILREHVVEHPCPPAEMLQMLNARLYAARLDARFVAMLFALYDASTRQITFASAGAPHPLLVRNGKVEELIIEGVPLGLLPEIEYDIMKVDLLPGDLLVFASDGIVESESPHREEFGAERLAAILENVSASESVEDVSGAILLATDKFSGSAPSHDDRTLLVLRVREELSPADYARMPVIY
jgi:phosphoserine phosphatase RsbU/P